MTDKKKTVQHSKTDDFRRVEMHVEESTQGPATERITVHKEEVVPMAVKKVVRETIVPVVTSRKVESYEDGKVVATEHDVVPDEALTLKQYEARVSQDDITRAVEAAMQRTFAAAMSQFVPVPAAPHIQPHPATAVEQKNNSADSPYSFELDSSLILYAVVALEAAAIVYLTVLKGWLLN